MLNKEIKSIYLKLLKRGISGLSLSEFAYQYQSNKDFLAKMELFTSLHEYCQRADIFHCFVNFPLSFIKTLFDKYLPYLPALAHARFIKAFHQKQTALDPNSHTWTNPDRLNAFINKLIATTGDILQALMIFQEIPAFPFPYHGIYTQKFIQFINQEAPFDKEQLGWFYIEKYSDYNMHRYHVNCQKGGIYHDLYRGLQDLHQHILKLRSQQRHNKANQVGEKIFDLYLLFGNLVTRSENPRIFAKKINDILADENTQKIINQHQSPWRKFLRAFYEFLQHLCLGFGFYNNYKRGGYVKTETAAILHRIDSAAKSLVKKTRINPYIQQIQDIYTQPDFSRQPRIDEQEIFKALCAQYVSSSQSKSIFSKAPLSSLASTLAQATNPFTQLNQHLTSIDLSKAPEFNKLLRIYFLSHPQAMEHLDPAIQVKINAKTFYTTHFDSEAITKFLTALIKTGTQIDKCVIEETNKAYPECIGPCLNYLLSCLGVAYCRNSTANLVCFKDIMPTAIKSQLFARLLVLLDQVPSNKDYDKDIAELLGEFAADLPEAGKVRAAQGLAKAIQGLNNRYDFTGHDFLHYNICLAYITALAKIISVIEDPNTQKQMAQFLMSQYRQYGYIDHYITWRTIAIHTNNEEFYLDIVNKFLTDLESTSTPIPVIMIMQQLGILASEGTPKVKSKIIQSTLDILQNNPSPPIEQEHLLRHIFLPIANNIPAENVSTVKQEVKSALKDNNYIKEVASRILKVIEESQSKNIAYVEQKHDMEEKIEVNAELEIEEKPQQNQEAINTEQPTAALVIPTLHQRLNLFNPLHASMLHEQIMSCWNDFYARKLEETTQFMEDLLDHIAPEQYAYFLHIFLPSRILPGEPKDKRDLAFIYLILHLGNLPQIQKALKETLHDSKIGMALEVVNIIAKYA